VFVFKCLSFPLICPKINNWEIKIKAYVNFKGAIYIRTTLEPCEKKLITKSILVQKVATCWRALKNDLKKNDHFNYCVGNNFVRETTQKILSSFLFFKKISNINKNLSHMNNLGIFWGTFGGFHY
jgi:hypothetical protein